MRLYVPGRHHTGDWARNSKFMRRRIITLHQLLHDVARLRRCGEDGLLRGSFLLCIADGLHSPMDEVGWDGATSNVTATRPVGADPAQRAVAPVVITSSTVSVTSMAPSAVLHHGVPFPDRDNLHTLLRKRIAAASHVRPTLAAAAASLSPRSTTRTTSPPAVCAGRALNAAIFLCWLCTGGGLGRRHVTAHLLHHRLAAAARGCMLARRVHRNAAAYDGRQLAAQPARHAHQFVCHAGAPT